MKVPKIHVSSLIIHRHTKQKEIKKYCATYATYEY